MFLSPVNLPVTCAFCFITGLFWVDISWPIPFASTAVSVLDGDLHFYDSLNEWHHDGGIVTEHVKGCGNGDWGDWNDKEIVQYDNLEDDLTKYCLHVDIN